MKFAVMGTGGVGGFFGGKLAKSGEEVWFVARGKHLEAMRSSGLRVHSTGGDFAIPSGRMTNHPEEVGACDVVLFCVKSYDTESVSRRLAPLLKSNTIIISLQNGVDNEEKIQRFAPAGMVWGGVSYIYSTITAPGEITETGGPKKIIFGPVVQDDATEHVGNRIRATLRQAGINAAFSPDIRLEIWKKFIFISAIGGLTALTRLTLGEILRVEHSRTLLEDAMNEVVTIAKACKVNIGEGYVNEILDSLKTFNNNSRSSMYHDLAHERPMEVEALSGAVVRYGSELGIPTPIHRIIYASLLPFHLKHISTQGVTS